MSSVLLFGFAGILVLLWIISGGFISQASSYIHPYKDKDNNINNAYWYAFWAAFITWTLVCLFAIVVILIILGVVGLFATGVGEAGVAVEGGVAAAEGGALLAEEGAVATEGALETKLGSEAVKKGSKKESKGVVETGISWIAMGFLIFALILVGITGILSALCASDLAKSPNFNPSDQKLKTAYNDAIISASLCLGAAGLLIIGIITYFIIGEQKASKAKKMEEIEKKSFVPKK